MAEPRLRGRQLLAVVLVGALSVSLIGCDFLFGPPSTSGHPPAHSTKHTTKHTTPPPSTTQATTTSTLAAAPPESLPEDTVSGEFDTTLNDPQGFVSDPDAEAAMVETIAHESGVAESRVQVQMTVTTAAKAASFLTERRLAATGTVKVSFRVLLLRGTFDGVEGMDEVVRRRLRSMSRQRLAKMIQQSISARKERRGQRNRFSVKVDRVKSPSVAHGREGDADAVATAADPATTFLPLERSQASDAHLLLTATFGPTRASLAELSATESEEAWVQAQMELPVGSHRQHYRERVAPKMTAANHISGPRARCSKGSRWWGFAFRHNDVGKSVTVHNNEIWLDGVHVSDIDPGYSLNGLSPPVTCTDQVPPYWVHQGKDCPVFAAKYVVPQKCFAGVRQDWEDNRYCQQTCFDGGSGWPGDDCSVGWPNLDVVGYICDVRDGVGAWMRLSTSSACNSNFIAMLNPAIWFENPADGTATSLAFETVAPGILVIAESPETCSFGDVLKSNAEGPYRFYMHESRMALTDNAPAAPALRSSFRGSLCPTAPRTFLNEKSGCRVVPTDDGCAPLEMRRVKFALNASNIMKLAVGAGRKVFALRGLHPTASPCGRSSRWRRFHCQTGSCPGPSSLAVSDEEALREALLAASEQGWLRDVEAVACKAAVPAGVVVDLGADGLFEHVHDDEYNVYDFTGMGAAANWTVRGDTELHLPKRADASLWDLGMSRWASHASLLGRFDADVSLESLQPHFRTHVLFDSFSARLAGSSNYAVVCGSPFEVANRPAAGHHMPFHMNVRYVSDGYDYDYDGGPYMYMSQYGREAKRNVMLNKALYGDDQLRQRMAWALSQVITVATHDGPADLMTEMYVAFYDIFVRHAFGNYRDIMREMTYSPMMANWLTYVNNKAVDVDELFPDENYAREIMQVFSIGLWKLHRNGTRMTDANGDDLRSYENRHIVEFARVFTGLVEQSKRGNIEDNGRTQNLLDPLQMKADWHDAYPKPDLNGAYLGDGYPLCSDLPPLSFLAAGAKFSFLSSGTRLDARPLVVGSPLFTALCGASSAPCTFQATVELGAPLHCEGAECLLEGVSVVQVADGFYRYVPPACVHPFFWETGQVMNADHGHSRWYTSDRWRKCVNAAAEAAGVACCKGCTDKPNPWLEINGYSCANITDRHPSVITNACKNSLHWSTQKYCQKTCWDYGVGYPFTDCSPPSDFAYERLCAHDGEKVSYAEAERRCASKGMHVCPDVHKGTGGCDFFRDFLWTPETCSVQVLVHRDGTVSVDWEQLTKKAKFPVEWKDGFPLQDSAGHCPDPCTAEEEWCVCPFQAEVVDAFDDVPTKDEALATLKVGAFPPSTPCTLNCGGEVEGFETSGSIDNATVFRIHGHFYKNVELRVFIAGFEFRNPPTFMLKYESGSKAANDEIEALLDHLFTHENTPIFLAYRLIQRFTTSNPSGKYIHDVQEAFRTGHFNGTKYGGVYGDLAATAAAIVLHPEARLQGVTSGLLREPLLKIVHFMRSLEYRSRNGREVQLRDLINRVGQWPYSAPDVFNFYHPEYHPEGFPDGLVGPEFQIWTMPNIMAYLNGMVSMVRFGHSQCGGGLGWPQPDCTGGSFTFTEADVGNGSSTVAELGLLLAGGRLSGQEVSALSAQYEGAAAGAGLQAVMYASIVTPGFATLGNHLHPSHAVVEAEPAPPPPARDYRAVVMLYLPGGIDSFQMLVPMNCPLYDEYVGERQSIALPPEQLLGISAAGQSCIAPEGQNNFGIHALLPLLKELYDAGELAFVSNIGSLVEPLTRETFESGSGKRCNGLFSHIDQERAAHTLTCQTATPTFKGAGGRLGDALANGEQAYRTESFSTAGRAKWSLGFQTLPKIVDRRTGNVPLVYPNTIASALGEVTSVQHDNIVREEYRQQLKDSLRANDDLGEYMNMAKLNTTFGDGDNRLAQQLKQAAKLISARSARKAERDVFYTNLAGFDHHQALEEGLQDLLPQLNDALRLFVKELKEQGNFDKVTLVMNSDFGRTLRPNSNAGTDHGWVGHSFILGGAVKGGSILNNYPASLGEEHFMRIRHGRIIPEFPWESIMVPVAEWMGMGEAQKATVFPNLQNFNISEHILRRDAVFKN